MARSFCVLLVGVRRTGITARQGKWRGAMNARFRIRTGDGRELEPRTVEIFSELVRSGVVRPRDLVFDALTGEWVPAESHPMVRLLQDPLVNDPLSATLDAPLDLVEPEERCPEEEARDFIRRMDAEREADPQVAPLARELSLTSARPGVEEMAQPSPAVGGPRPPGRSMPSERPSPVAAVRAASQRRRRSRLLVPASAGAALVVAVLALPAPREAPQVPARVAVGLAPRADGALPAAEAWVREAALDAFAGKVEILRQELGLGDPPADWLEGRYLARAASYPEVREYWERMAAVLDETRAREVGLYREAYLEVAEGRGMAGPLRSLRLATALEDFSAAEAARGGVYARGREMAAAALALHDVLVALGPRVTYEPLRGGRVSADPVLEAAGADPEAQLLLESALDRVLGSLRGVDGASLRDRNRMGSWLAEALAEVSG